MRFKNLKYFNFRNLANSSIDTDAENIILEGVNGQGKTNILESVYLLSYGSSFRTANVREAITFNQERMHIVGTAVDDDGQQRRIEYINQDGKRRIILDGKDVKDRKDLIYTFPVIVFSHEDINFVKGEPEFRRRFFDQTFSLYNPSYLDSLRRYKTILAQRNAAIKGDQKSLMGLYDGRLAKYGLEVLREREKGVAEFNEIFPVLYRQISGMDTELVIRYQPSWKELRSEDEVISYLESTRDRDLRLMTTSSGIHRDRFLVYDENGPFSQSGSTGQIRLASILFRLAEARFFSRMSGKEPILLVDDVLLELDSAKRGAFLQLLDHYSQAFFTFLPEEKYFSRIKESTLKYTVSGGRTEKC